MQIKRYEMSKSLLSLKKVCKDRKHKTCIFFPPLLFLVRSSENRNKRQLNHPEVLSLQVSQNTVVRAEIWSSRSQVKEKG